MAAISVCFMWSLACLRVLLALVHFHALVSPPYMHVSSSFLHLALTARLGSIMGVASLSCKLGSIPASPLLCDFEQRLNAAFMSSPEKNSRVAAFSWGGHGRVSGGHMDDTQPFQLLSTQAPT